MLLNSIVASFCFVAVAQGAAIPAQSPKVLKLDYTRADTPFDDVEERGTAELNFVRENSYYLTDLYFSSSMQKITVAIDTGSSDLWVMDKDSGIDTDYGTYDSSKAKSTSKSFSIKYFDSSSAKGDYVKDEVSLTKNGPTIPNFQFANAKEASKIKHGILGLGLKQLEQTGTKYDNFPIALKKSRVTKKAAYSIFSTDEDKQSGTVLFGGVDKAKYSGSLKKLAITKDSSRLSVNVASVGYNGKTVNVGQAVTLDTGSSNSHLQPEIVKKIAEAAGLKEGNGFYYWKKCTDAKDITISFDGIDIKVPVKYMTTPLKDAKGNKLSACALSILPSTKANTLGANFLRSVYAVFDVEDKTISLAPIKFSSKENIVELS